MKIDFAVVSDYALVDQYGKLSVMGIFQHIWVPQFPALHPRLHLVLRVKEGAPRSASTGCGIRFTGEDGNQILSGDGTVGNFAEPPAGVTEIEAGAVLVFDVPFERPGRYQFEIIVDDEVETFVPITVGQAPAATSQGGAAGQQ